MPKKATPTANPSQIRDKFLERAGELWDLHEEEFMQVLEEAESKKINLTIKASLDMSETAAKLQTGISFSQVVKDAREDVFDDPNQRPLIPKGEDEEEKPRVTAGKGDTKAAAKKGGKGGRQSDFVPLGAEKE